MAVLWLRFLTEIAGVSRDIIETLQSTPLFSRVLRNNVEYHATLTKHYSTNIL